MKFEDLKKYQFDLPENLIRSTGVEPRDSARLFIYDTASNTITHDIFRNIGKYLPESSMLVFNETKVLPARLQAYKESSGKIEIFLLINEWLGDTARIPFIANRKLDIGQKILYEGGFLRVEAQEENIFFASLHDNDKRTLQDILLEIGTTPIPPYLKENKQEESELRQRYQTVFAEDGISVAAPTASLHFTKELLQNLEKQGIESMKLSLDVGLGTFAKLKEENFLSNTLHIEYVTYTQDFLDALEINAGKPLVAVGTTTVRALETLSQKNIQSPGRYATDIFISPGYRFAHTDHLITNFHTPGSSLLLLVDAFLQHKGANRSILELYDTAIEEGYAFYSFGDAMLIL